MPSIRPATGALVPAPATDLAAIRTITPHCDEVTVSRDTAFAKIKARVDGTALAERTLNGS